MNKKVLVAISAAVVVLILAIIGVMWLGNRQEEAVNNEELPKIEEKEPEEPPYVGPEIPNIINKAGYINKTDKNRITVRIAEEDITVYVDKNTKIYGPDGKEKDRTALIIGAYVTIEINGDEVEEGDTSFYAQTIYVSGK